MQTNEHGMRIAHDLVLRTTTAQLADRYGEYFTEATVARFVEQVVEELEARFRIKTHLPTFALRFARDRLDAMALPEGKIVGNPPSVVFVCQRDAAVSQMAAALFARDLGDTALVHHTGARMAEGMPAEAVHALLEVGVEVNGEPPGRADLEIVRGADVVVTLDATDSIELVEDRTTHYLAWRLSGRVGGYRALRSELEPLVASLAARVAPAAEADALRPVPTAGVPAAAFSL